MIKKKKLSRLQFEKLILGPWKSHKGDRYRQNGKFRTYVKDPYKFISNGDIAFRAKSWQELASLLKIGVPDNAVPNLEKIPAGQIENPD